MEIMRESHLLRTVKSAVPALKKAMISCLAPENEKVLILTDVGENSHRVAGMVGAGCCMAAKELGLKTVFASQKPKTSMDNADSQSEDAMKRLEEGNIIILCVSNKLGRMRSIGKSFRGFAVERNHRFVSTTGVGTISNGDFGRLLSSMNIDYMQLRGEQMETKNLLDRAKEVHVTAKAGTDVWLRLRKGSALSNDGNYTMPGTGGNLPAGEVYLPPAKGRSDGLIVVDGSSRNEFGTWLVRNPFRMTVEKGRVVSIEGGKEAKLLEAGLLLAEEKAKYPERVRCLAELGIGFNTRAGIIGSMIVDEKTKGTCHFAIGSNYWFGGHNRTIVHFDQLVKSPKIEIDGKALNV